MVYNWEFLPILRAVLVIELGVLWGLIFYEDSFFKTLANFKFWFFVSCGLVCFYTFNKTSVITEIKDNEIVREVFIGGSDDI